MKKNLLMLAVALSTTMLLGACNRDRDGDDTAAVDTTTPAEPAATEPAPMPAEPAPTPAPAATPTDSGMSFADMDKNKDGSVTHDELADTEMLHQHFSEADTNGDGKLSSAEVDKHRADMAAAPGG